MTDSLLLPESALASYLQTHVARFRGPLTATKFKGGQSNPTYLIEGASGKYVLRRKPPGKLLASAHAVDREFRVIGSLANSAVPVARPLHLCTDDSIIGSMFYLMEYVPGRIFWDPTLPELSPVARTALYAAALDALVALTRVDVAACGLADYGKPGNYFSRQVARWTEQYRAAETERLEAMETLIDWLPGAVPADDGRVALVHGDFRVDNLIWDAHEPHLAAIVDWELSTLGHPYADLAYFCMALRLPRNGILPGLAGAARTALGIPEETAMIEHYVAASGLDPRPHWPFLLAFQFFRLAAIAQGVLRRALQGNASSERAMQAGAMAHTIADLGVGAAQIADVRFAPGTPL
ncbi:MAG: phosphotransferase [Rudaea sp.]|nr:phosphotransferase [Rudaea sp.]